MRRSGRLGNRPLGSRRSGHDGVHFEPAGHPPGDRGWRERCGDIVGTGVKSGTYYALDADTGGVVLDAPIDR